MAQNLKYLIDSCGQYIYFRKEFEKALESGSFDSLPLSTPSSAVIELEKLYNLFSFSGGKFTSKFQQKVLELDLVYLLDNVFAFTDDCKYLVDTCACLDSLIYGGDPYTVACHKKFVVENIYHLIEDNASDIKKALDKYSSALAKAEYERELELLSE